MHLQHLANLLLGNLNLTLREVTLIGSTLTVEIESNATSARCPACHRESWKQHSVYERFPGDLPWAQWAVVFRLRVKRFSCHNRACAKRTFAERFPDWLQPFARQTIRRRERQQCVAIEVNARMAQRTLQRLGMPVSDSTINCFLRTLEEPPTDAAVRVIGIDDWAQKKGHTYGTIIVDHESGVVIDLLPDREAETVEHWMAAHPEIEIVTRDRANNYARGVEAGNPQALQIADRFHLLQNATEMLVRLFTNKPHLLPRIQLETEHVCEADRMPDATPGDGQVSCTVIEATELTAYQETHVFGPAEERFVQVKALQQSGVSQRAIARQLQIDRRTVSKYFELESHAQVRRRRRRQIDPYLAFLHKRWEEGVTNRVQLYAELVAQGFTGSLVALYRATSEWQSPATPTARIHQPHSRRLSAREAAWLLLLDEERLSSIQKRKREVLLQHAPDVPIIRAETLSFINAIKNRDSTQLQRWLDSALNSQFKQIRHFARHIQADLGCIMAALQNPFSNGRTEGHVHRLKMIKRMMYGRAKFELLRKRVLLQGSLGFNFT